MPKDDLTADADKAQQAVEAQALVGILGRLAGFSELPLANPASDPVPLPPLGSSVETLSAARHLPPALKLELLARLVNSPQPNFDRLNVEGVARTLVHPSLHDAQIGVAAELTKALFGWKEGTEPLGRNALSDLEHPPPGHISYALLDDVQCTALTITPACSAAKTPVDGFQAMSIVTEMYTCKPFEAFKPIINPLQWPDCWLESFFFKSMTAVPNLPVTGTPRPDASVGWSQTLLETVDFGFAIAPDGTQQLQTELDFLYFWNGPDNTVAAGPHGGPGSPPSIAATTAAAPGVLTGAATPVVTRSPVPAAGCTYDLRSSQDGRILVDQGFLLVEEVPGHDYRRYRTQKEVRFASGNPPADVCTFWSLATGMIMQGC